MLLKILQNDIRKSCVRWFCSVNPLAHLDKTQVTALSEKCYLVNEKDKIIGNATKKECHFVKDDDTIPLHRAFSVFLFNMRGDLLLQRRAASKITYPDCYTNSCCSHPLADYPGEDEEANAIGIKRAARRRLNYELGIPLDQLPLEAFKYLTRIHYYDVGDGRWGEHEIDYILCMQADVKIKPNPNEVNEISWIPLEHMNTFVPELESPLTPWFHIIYKHRLRLWWADLDQLDKFIDRSVIHKLKP